MASKWAKVLDALPESPVKDRAYQDKVDAMKAGIPAACACDCDQSGVLPYDAEAHASDCASRKENITIGPEMLAQCYRRSEAELDRIEALRYNQQIISTALEQMLADSWDRDEPGWGAYGGSQNTVRLPDGSRVEAKAEPEFTVVDKEAFRQWCIASPDVCMTCDGGEASGVHHNDSDPARHAFKPGGGLEKSLMLWPSTTKSIAGQRLIAGASLPDGVEATFRKVVKFVKAPTRGGGE